MNIGTAIYTALSANAPLVALVGSRIYKLTAPQGAVAPYVVWQGISSNPGAVHVGATGATERIYQFACFAATAEAATAVREALIAAIDGVALGNGDTGTLEDDARDDYDEALQLYRADADFHF